jgi:hypothetical protein
MGVVIGTVNPFPHPKADKEQAKKILEEGAEVFGALQRWKSAYDQFGENHIVNSQKQMLLGECADVIQATGNMIAGLGIEDFTPYMMQCEKKNRDRGRYD